MRADRLLAMMMLLQTRGKMTAQALAERLEVSRRTILRDIDALSAAGVPIYADGGHGGGIALDEDYRTTLAGLQDREIRTLFVGDNSQPLGDLGLGAAADRTLLKLLAVLPAAHRPSVEHMRQRVLIDPAWWWRDAQPLPVLDDLQRAVYEDRCVWAVYERHDGDVVERRLAPYSLVAKSSVWYLVADGESGLRTYRVARFRQVALLDARVERRADFDLPAYWREHLQNFNELRGEYAFTLCMHPERINVVQRIVPGRYRQIEAGAARDSGAAGTRISAADGPAAPADGWITLEFHLESLELAKMLVFGLGEDALVLEPPSLREAVVATARALLDRWDA